MSDNQPLISASPSSKDDFGIVFPPSSRANSSR